MMAVSCLGEEGIWRRKLLLVDHFEGLGHFSLALSSPPDHGPKWHCQTAAWTAWCSHPVTSGWKKQRETKGKWQRDIQVFIQADTRYIELGNVWFWCNYKPFGMTQWTHQWWPHHHYYDPFSEKQTKKRLQSWPWENVQKTWSHMCLTNNFSAKKYSVENRNLKTSRAWWISYLAWLTWKKLSTCSLGASSWMQGCVYFPIMS